MHAAPAASAPDLPAYVTSSSGFAAHPSAIIAQNKALLEQIDGSRRDAAQKVKAWEDSIKERELAEKRRKAPGWLDSESKILEPEKPIEVKAEGVASLSLMDEPQAPRDMAEQKRTEQDLGDAMDRAFGRSEMG